MSDGFNGGCRCGAVRYRLAVDRLPATYACHCLDCQTWSGSAFSQQAVFPENLLTLEGRLAVYELPSPSGRISVQRVCAVCYTRVYNTNTARPGVASIRAGTLDESDKLRVVAHIFAKRKQPWIDLPATALVWQEAAPPDALAAALTA